MLAALAEHGTVTAAAKAMHYAQASVSHHLARLEAETGARLVQRAGRGVRLTAAGRLLARRAVEILGRLDAAEAELADHTGLRAGGVTVAAFPSAVGTFVPRAFAGLRTSHPGLALTLVEAEPPEALRLLRAGEVDLAVVFRHAGQAPTAADSESGVHETELLDEELHIVTAGGLRPPSTRLADYAGQDWIAGCTRCREHLLALCTKAGFAPRITYTSDDYVAVQNLVVAGLGVTTLPALALLAFRHHGVRTAVLPDSTRRILVASYGDPPDPPPVVALRAALVRAVAELAT